MCLGEKVQLKLRIKIKHFHEWVKIEVSAFCHLWYFIVGGSEDVMLSCTSGSPLPFLTLEPPISDTDYNFSLDITEGVYDLFDFNF